MALSTVGGWFGSAIISNLVDTAHSCLGERMLTTDTESELCRLKAALPKIKAVMDVAEVLKFKQPNSGVNEWLEQFKEAFLAAEDVLDELKYRELEDKVKTRDPVSGSSSSILGSVKRKLTDSTIGEDTLKRLSVAVKMLDLVAADVGNFFQFATALNVHSLPKPNNKPLYTSSRDTTSFLTERKVFGRESEKAIIIDWLKIPSSHDHISVFCIVGEGGLGKTTLAQLVFEEINRDNHYDKTIWVCVSTSFSVEDITRKILQELGEKVHDNESFNRLQIKLKEKVLSNKVLFILDDVWNDEKLCDWEKLIAPLKFVQQGSKILLTTRMKSVADMLACVLNVEQENLVLEGLEEKELLELFNNYAFHCYNPDNHKDLQIIGNDIVKKLLGSPLAAKVIGSLLNSYMDFHYWKGILSSDSLINLEQAMDVEDMLKLCYYHLPTDLQECFKFCSIFPQDYEFEKEVLIKMWMASGFIRQELHGQERPEDIGEEYFNHLLMKSFFERHYWKNNLYVMHDLMNDLSQNVSKGECCRVEPNGKSYIIPCTVQHVSVHESEIERIFILRNLRTLVITSSSDGTIRDQFILPNGSLKESLRILVIGIDRSEVSEEIGRLIHLRFLKISACSVKNLSLPNSIYKFYHLQFLEMSNRYEDSDYEGVETGMTNLVSLRYINLPNWVMQNVRGVNKLTSLQELNFTVGRESGHHIDELEKLNNLRSLDICDIENVGDPVEATNANLPKKESLISLYLCWTEGSNYDNPEQVIDNLQPHPNLKDLAINGYTGQRSPIWMRHLSHLETLYFSHMPKWESWTGPHSCYRFSNLNELRIRDCPNLANLPSIPVSLVIFEVHNVGLNSLPDMYHGSSITSPAPSRLKSSLRVVKITECPKLTPSKGFLQQKNLDLQTIEELTIRDYKNLLQLRTEGFGKLTSLKHLTISNCPNLTKLPNLPLSLNDFTIFNVGVSDLPEYFQSSRSSGLTSSSLKASLRNVEIYRCSNLTSLNGFLQHENIDLLGLQKLTIQFCENLVHLPTSAFGKFVSLKHLVIAGNPKLVTVHNQSILLPIKLETLELENCGELDVPFLESASQLPALATLYILNSEYITCIPSSGNAFTSLRTLQIQACDRLIECGCDRLVEFSSMQQAHTVNTGNNLVSLSISHLHIDHLCLLLIEPFRCLRFVSQLEVENCSDMEALPEQWLLQNGSTLKSLVIDDASSLLSLPGTMVMLTALERLDISYAPMVEEIPLLPTSLIRMNINGISAL